MASHMMGPLLRASFLLDLAGTGSRISQIGNATIDRIRHLLCHYQIHFLKFFNVVYLFTSHWRFLKITWAGMWFTLFKVLIFLGEEWIFHVFPDFLRSNWPTETAPCFWSLWHLVLLVSMSLSSLCWCLLLASLMPASIHLECCAYSSKKDRKTAFFLAVKRFSWSENDLPSLWSPHLLIYNVTKDVQCIPQDWCGYPEWQHLWTFTSLCSKNSPVGLL